VQHKQAICVLRIY